MFCKGLKTLVWLSGLRWAIEQCFEETKTESITLSQFRILLKVLLTMKKHTVKSLIEQILWIQARNHRAYLSHRIRRMNKLAYYTQVAL